MNVIGKSKIKISALGMGCWSYGGGSYWGSQAQKDVNDIVSLALDRGINYFDTAEVYNDGESERSLGIALKGRRHEAVVGSKVSTSNTRPADLRQHCENSLMRLQTDYIDIYMLHWPVNRKAIEHFTDDPELIANPPTVREAFATLAELKKEGKIREIGVSNHGVGQMKEVLGVCPDIAVNELPYNLISRAIESEILPFCVEKGIGVLGYMAFQQGILTGTFQDLSGLTPAQAHSRHFHFSRGGNMARHTEEGAEKEIIRVLEVVSAAAKELGGSPATVSLSWAMMKKGISNTLVGSRDCRQLLSNIEAAEFVLPAEYYNLLNDVSLSVLRVLGDNPDYYQNREESRVW